MKNLSSDKGQTLIEAIPALLALLLLTGVIFNIFHFYLFTQASQYALTQAGRLASIQTDTKEIKKRFEYYLVQQWTGSRKAFKEKRKNIEKTTGEPLYRLKQYNTQYKKESGTQLELTILYRPIVPIVIKALSYVKYNPYFRQGLIPIHQNIQVIPWQQKQ
ncbi:MAG: hypothetical protein KGV48_001065 [Alcaligenaceae bacterium]|nr:hypothetical protein [Alcaligenaceae bacterium]